jgi:hypothetical protein
LQKVDDAEMMFSDENQDKADIYREKIAKEVDTKLVNQTNRIDG